MVANKAKTAPAEESGRSGHHKDFQSIIKLQEELEKVNTKAREKIMEIERKYKDIRAPIYARRNRIIKKIPDLWLSAFLRHPVLKEMLTDYDREIFGYLGSLNVADFPDPSKGYRISFTFKENPYFENKRLKKTIEFTDDGTLMSVGTNIKWKRGKWPKGKKNYEKSKNKWPLPFPSFFNWISDPWVNMDRDLVAEIIKEEVWPNPIDHFNNEEEEYDDEDDEDEEEGENNGEDDDGEDGGSGGDEA